MDNFKFIIPALLVICLIGLWDTHNIKKDLFNYNQQSKKIHKTKYENYNSTRNRNLFNLKKTFMKDKLKNQNNISNQILMSLKKK